MNATHPEKDNNFDLVRLLAALQVAISIAIPPGVRVELLIYADEPYAYRLDDVQVMPCQDCITDPPSTAPDTLVVPSDRSRSEHGAPVNIHAQKRNGPIQVLTSGRAFASGILQN